MKNIIVALDLNYSSAPLLQEAEKMASGFGAKVWLIHVAAPNPDFVGYDVGPKYIRETRAEELRAEHRQLQQMADNLKAKGVEAEGLLIQGATVLMLLEETQRLNADLMIIGNHKHGFIYKIFIGDTSDDLIQEAGIPLLLVPVEE